MTELVLNLYNQTGEATIRHLIRQELGLTLDEAFIVTVLGADGYSVTLKATFPEGSEGYHKYAGEVTFSLEKVNLGQQIPFTLPWEGAFPPDPSLLFTYLYEVLGLWLDDEECYLSVDPSKTPLVRSQTLPEGLALPPEAEGQFKLVALGGSVRWSKGSYLTLKHTSANSKTTDKLLELTGSPPDGDVGEAYHFTYEAKGGTPPYRFQVIEGSFPGELDQDTGELTIPSIDAGLIGYHSWRAAVFDATGKRAFIDSAMNVRVADLIFKPARTDITTKVGDVTTIKLGIRGGIPPYTYTLLEGSLPEGATLGDNRLVAQFEGSLQPRASVTQTYFIQVKDANDVTAYSRFKITVEDHTDEALAESLSQKLVSWFDVPKDGLTDGDVWADRKGYRNLVAAGSLPVAKTPIEGRLALDYSDGYLKATEQGFSYTSPFSVMTFLGASTNPQNHEALISQGAGDGGWGLTRFRKDALGLEASFGGDAKAYSFGSPYAVVNQWVVAQVRAPSVALIAKRNNLLAEQDADLTVQGWGGEQDTSEALLQVAGPSDREGYTPYHGQLGDLTFFEGRLWSDELKWLYNHGLYRRYWELIPQPELTLTYEQTSERSEVLQPYNGQVTLGGGVPPYTVKLTRSAPHGLTFDPETLRFEGAPRDEGTGIATLKVTDRRGVSKEFNVPFAFDPSSIAVEGDLVTGEVSLSYLSQLTLSGPTSPYSDLTFDADKWLPGLIPALEDDTLTVQGLPTQAGNVSDLVTFKDSDGESYALNLTFRIAEKFTIATDQSVLTSTDKAVSYPLVFEGGVAPFSFNLANNPFPGILNLSNTGLLEGPVVQAGEWELEVEAEDSLGVTAQSTVQLEVDKALMLSFHYDEAKVGERFQGILNIKEGVPPFTVEVSSESLANGLDWTEATRSVEGEPTESGTFVFAFKATDSKGITGVLNERITIAPRDLALVGSFPETRPGTVVDYTYHGRYGRPPYRFELTDGAFPGSVSVTEEGHIHGNVQYDEATWTLTVYDADNRSVSLREYWEGAPWNNVPGHFGDDGGVVETDLLAARNEHVITPGKIDFTPIKPFTDHSLVSAGVFTGQTIANRYPEESTVTPGSFDIVMIPPQRWDSSFLQPGSFYTKTGGGADADGVYGIPGKVSRLDVTTGLEKEIHVPPGTATVVYYPTYTAELSLSAGVADVRGEFSKHPEENSVSVGSFLGPQNALMPRDDTQATPGKLLYIKMFNSGVSDTLGFGGFEVVSFEPPVEDPPPL